MKVNDDIRRRIDAWFAQNRDTLLGDLSRLIGIKSVLDEAKPGMPYGEGAARALECSREILSGLGIGSAVFEDCIAEADVDGSEDAKTSDADAPFVPKLGILVHVDTVAAHDGWTSDPFTAEIRGGVLYGRGATDNKGPAVASMYALAAARDIARDLNPGGLKHGARLLVGSAEEIGCVDMARYLAVHRAPEFNFAPDADYPLVNVEKGRFVFSFKHSWEPETALPRVQSIDGGDTSNIVPRASRARVLGLPLADITKLCDAFASKTYAHFTARESDGGVDITALGTASHASRPTDGNNAQTALLSLLAALPLAAASSTDAIRALARVFPHGETDGATLGIAARDEVSGALTLSFGVLRLRETGLEADFDSRTPKVSDAMDLPALSANALAPYGFIPAGHTRTACHYTPADSPLVQTLLGIYERFTGQPGCCLALGGTTYVHNIEGGVAFGCEMPDTDHRIHGADEFFGVEDLLTSAKMFTAAVLELCG